MIEKPFMYIYIYHRDVISVMNQLRRRVNGLARARGKLSELVNVLYTFEILFIVFFFLSKLMALRGHFSVALSSR